MIHHSLKHPPQRLALHLEYNGGCFHGSQFQHQDGLIRPTVEHALQEAFAALHIPLSALHFSGRTDAGVHAQGQVLHLDLEPNALAHIPHLPSSLNAKLPSSISIKGASPAAAEFHSQLSAKQRWYRYQILNRPTRSAVAPIGSTWVKEALCLETMTEAAIYLLGEHDFKSFKCPDTPNPENICVVSYVSLHKSDDFIIFDIVANRFLYKMVRNIVGLLVSIGKINAQQAGAFPPQRIQTVLNAGDRKEAGPSAKAEGLTLMAVQYSEPFNYFHQDPLVKALERFMKPQHLGSAVSIRPNSPTTIHMESIPHENLYSKVF